MQFRKRLLEIGDEVKIIDSLYSHCDYAQQLNNFIGVTGEITDISPSGNCEVSFNGDFWWYAPSCLQYIGDTDHVKLEVIKPRLKLFVGKSLDMLSLRNANVRVNHNIRNSEYELYDEIVYKGLSGKIGIVIESNYNIQVPHGLFSWDNSNNKKDEYIGLIFDGEIYYLPLCVLFSVYPVYDSRTINKNI